MTDQRPGLLATIPRHLAPLSTDALRIADEFVMGLLAHEKAHGPIDLQTVRHFAPAVDPRDEPTRTVVLAAIVTIGIALREQDREREELREQALAELGFAPPPPIPPEQLAELDRMREQHGPASLGVPPHLLEPLDPPPVLGPAEPSPMWRNHESERLVPRRSAVRVVHDDGELPSEFGAGDA